MSPPEFGRCCAHGLFFFLLLVHVVGDAKQLPHGLIPQSHLLRGPYGLTFLRSVEILRPPQYFYGYIP